MQVIGEKKNLARVCLRKPSAQNTFFLSMPSSPGPCSSDQVCLLVFGSSGSSHHYYLLHFYFANRKSLLCCKIHSAVQASYQRLLCLAGMLYVLTAFEEAFFSSLLFVDAFHAFKGNCRSFRFAALCEDIEENRLFFCMLISRRKKMQLLLLDTALTCLIFFPMLKFHMACQRKQSTGQYMIFLLCFAYHYDLHVSLEAGQATGPLAALFSHP